LRSSKSRGDYETKLYNDLNPCLAICEDIVNRSISVLSDYDNRTEEDVEAAIDLLGSPLEGKNPIMIDMLRKLPVVDYLVRGILIVYLNL
jgi:hypothetical protein